MKRLAFACLLCLLALFAFAQTQAGQIYYIYGVSGGQGTLTPLANASLVNGQVLVTPPTTYGLGLMSVVVNNAPQISVDTAIVPTWAAFKSSTMALGQPCPGSLPGAGPGVLSVDSANARLWFCLQGSAAPTWVYLPLVTQ